MKYASIIPLIGGQTLGMQDAVGNKPAWLASWPAFSANDQHAKAYYTDVPFHNIEEGPKIEEVDVISTTCPCAGLSSLSPTSNSKSAHNDWMINSAKYVLGELRPKVFWGENAPRLASKMGRPIVEKLVALANAEGYSFSIYKTKTLLHGGPQVRDRTFYFFWRGDLQPRAGMVPLFDRHNEEHSKIEDVIAGVARRNDDPMNVITNAYIPTEDAHYRFILESMYGGISHKEFQATKIKTTTNAFCHLEEQLGIKGYLELEKWMRKLGFEKRAERARTCYNKLKSGGNIMRRGVEIPKNKIGAFVGHLPHSLTHPYEDRHLTYRECLTIMGMPDDFEIINPKKNLNHVCQNVPVKTASDMMKQIMKVLNSGDQVEWVRGPLIQCNKSGKNECLAQTSSLDSFIS